MTAAPDIARLKNFFAGYFHEDWAEDAPNVDAVLEQFFNEGWGSAELQVLGADIRAYIVLKDPRRRSAYDRHLSGGDGLRMQLAEAKAAHAKQDSETRTGRTAQGKQFYQKAVAAEKSGDLATAQQHLQMALTFESDNALFKEGLERLRAERKAQKKK